MTISTQANSVVEILNNATGPAQIADLLRKLGIGTILRNLPVYLRSKNPNAAPANPYQITSTALQTITLPDDAKALTILRAYARTGTGTKGELVVSAYGVTPAANHLAVSPSGDIVFLAADAYTSVDIDYVPNKQDVVELTALVAVPGTGVAALPITTNKLLIPGVVSLMEAEILTGTAAGKKFVLVEADGAPAAGNARLDLAKANVQFAVADGATLARVKLGVACGPNSSGGGGDTDAVLEGLSGGIL